MLRRRPRGRGRHPSAAAAAARAKAAAGGLRLTLVRGDMRSFALRRGFALVVVSCNSLAHLTTSGDLRACLRRVRDHLAPGGLFAFDRFRSKAIADFFASQVPPPTPVAAVAAAIGPMPRYLDGIGTLASVSDHEQPRYLPGATKG